MKRGSIGGTTNQTVASKQGSAWTLVFDTSNRLALRSNATTISTSTATLTDTAGWHYVAASKSGSNVHLYLDGTDVTGSVTNVTLANSTSPLAIGQTGNGSFFKGTLDEVALYNAALASSQIASHYALGAAPTNTSPPAIAGVAQDGQNLTTSPGTWTASPSSYAYRWRRCDSSGAGCQDIGGATAQTYTNAPDDVGATLRVVVTARNASGASTSATSNKTATVAALAPANTTPPAISGTATETSSLAADPGVWSGTPGSYSYQWQRCGSDGNNCVDIAGATNQWYILAGGDVGHTMRLVVTETNPAGSASATSQATSIVAGIPPTVTAPPTITGGSSPATQGDQLYGHDATFGGTVTSRSWQWQRCDANGGSCADIDGAVSDFYQLDRPDIGATVRVANIATNATGSTRAYSTTRGPVQSGAPRTTTQPTVSGTASEGSRLTVTPASWTGGVTSHGYQWQRCEASGSRCSDLPDATNSYYDVTAVDVSHTVRVIETAGNVFGSTRVDSDRTPVITGSTPAQPPTNTAPPTVSGLAAEARTLTAIRGSWSGDSLAYWYQWQACDSSGSSCSDIDGATTETYVLTSAEVGHTVRVVVTADNALGSVGTPSAATGAVTPPVAPANIEPPKVSGGSASGDLLAATTGNWDDSASSYSYQWRTCDAAGNSCTDVPGAVHVGYWIGADDIGSTIRVRVTAKGRGASSTKNSDLTPVIDGVELPQAVQQKIRSITQAVIRNGAQETSALCDATCDQVRSTVRESNAAPGDAAWAIALQAADIEVDTGALPASPTAAVPTLDSPRPTGSSVWWAEGLCRGPMRLACELGTETAFFGWHLGTQLNAKFFHVGMGDPPPKTDQWANLGDPTAWLFNAGEQSGDWYTFGPQHYLGADWSSYNPGVPKTGWYLGDQNHTIHSIVDGKDTWCSQPFSTQPPPWEWVTEPHFNACLHWNDEPPEPWDVRQGGDEDLKAAYAPLRTPEGDPLNSPEDYNGQTALGLIHTTSVPPWPGFDEMQRRVRAALASGRKSELTKKLAYELGQPDACDPIETFVCNPPPGSTDAKDRLCEVSTPLNDDPDPSRGTTRFSPPLYAVVRPFTRTTPDGDTTNTALKYGWTEFRDGEWVGWGYRKIFAKHGWGQADIAATTEALATSPDALPPTRWQYTGPEYVQNGAVCARRVVVADMIERSTEPEPAEIVTSYGRWMGDG